MGKLFTLSSRNIDSEGNLIKELISIDGVPVVKEIIPIEVAKESPKVQEDIKFSVAIESPIAKEIRLAREAREIRNINQGIKSGKEKKHQPIITTNAQTNAQTLVSNIGYKFNQIRKDLFD